MAKKDRHVSETPATQWLWQHGVAFTEHPCDDLYHGGTAESARHLGVPEYQVIQSLARQIGVKTVAAGLSPKVEIDGRFIRDLIDNALRGQPLTAR